MTKAQSACSVSALEGGEGVWQRTGMPADEIRKLLHAAPFKPFTVYMPSEKAFAVPHPDFAWLTPNGRTLIVAPAGTGGVDILDVPLIVRIELAHTTASET